jgi:hypothetical protein
VANFFADFDQTLNYLGVDFPCALVSWIRTTNLLERFHQEIRHKQRNSGMFQSERGCEAPWYLIATRETAKQRAAHAGGDREFAKKNIHYHAAALLDGFERVIGRLHLGLQLCLPVMDGIDPHHNIGTLQKLMSLQERESKAVLPDNQFRCLDQRLDSTARLQCASGPRHYPSIILRDMAEDEKRERGYAEGQKLFRRTFSELARRMG